jgi:hypothetical protein
VNVDVTAPAYDFVEQRAAQPIANPRVCRFTDQDARDVLLPRVLEQRVADAVARESYDLSAQ